MELLRWMGNTFARFVAFSIVVIGGYTFFINAIESNFDSGTRLLILLTSALGVVGGALYLISYDGPTRWRTEVVRRLGWGGMLVSALLPTSLTLMLVPMVALLIPTLRNPDTDGAKTLREAEDN